MIRVISIAGTYRPAHCGVAHYTQQLRAKLSQLDIESRVLTTHVAAEAAGEPDVMGVVSDWSLSALMPLVRSLHGFSPNSLSTDSLSANILHIQHAAGTYGFERSIFLLPLLLRVTGWRKPIVTTIHEYGWWEWQPRWLPAPLLEGLKQWGQDRGWWDREDGFLLTHSDAIITTNSDAETVLRSRLPGLSDRITRITIAPNIEVDSIDHPTARQALLQTCGWNKDAEIIAFFGFLHPVKGLETLLAAFKQVIAVRPQARLLLIGGVESLALAKEQATDYWNQLQRLTAELHLDKAVHFTGYVAAETASCYLSGADIGVLPFNHGVTLKSGSLLALLAHGLPSVITQPNFADPTLADAPWLQIIPSRNVDRLTEALIKLLAQPDHYCLGQKTRQFAQQFSWDAIATAHIQIYQSVLDNSVQSHLRNQVD